MNPEYDDDQEPIDPQDATRLIDIPKIFHSLETGSPFQFCLNCDRPLSEDIFQPYLIQKIFRGPEVIIEFAMCLDCQEGQCSEGMSAESETAIRNFLQPRLNPVRRLRMLDDFHDQDDIGPWIERCLISEDPKGTFRDYQLVALCRGQKIQRDFYPVMISAPAMEQLGEMLSQSTKDWMDDFIGSNFGMPSEFCEPPSFTPILM